MIIKELKEWLAAANDDGTIILQNDATDARSDIIYIDAVNGVVIIHGEFKLNRDSKMSEIITPAVVYDIAMRTGATIEVAKPIAENGALIAAAAFGIKLDEETD